MSTLKQPDDMVTTKPVTTHAIPTPIQPREPVTWFAGVMETKLRENDHKGGWHDCDFDYLEKRIREELAELATVLMQYQIASLSASEVTRTRYLGERAKREAADVANFAMMIADRVRGELLDMGSADPEESDRAT